MTTREIEQHSRELLHGVRAMKADHEENCYIRLAEQNQLTAGERKDLETAVNGEIGDLKEAAAVLLETHMLVNAEADELATRLKEGESSGRKRRLFHAPPANSVIDLEEEKTGHFAMGLNFYKLILLVFIGSFAGVVVEMLWCLLTNGYLESRAGLVYGPFNLLYGVGAVTLSVCLFRYRNRSSGFSFAGGMIVGSVVEYVCSWGQELLFGSTSWDYSNLPFNLNGRICLLYSVFWGILGVLWMKNLYPRLARWILKLPNRLGKAFTVAMAVFLVVNGVVTLLAVDRWSERIAGEPAVTAADRLFDEHFPDARMERVFANMEFK
ncbi:MAG: hypothetical protein MSH16_07295 [Oscillospiraceae bacterium]|nr:hypothetical protein [Oscillospiraceae bacterium]MDD6502969.1 hypothetical protein [Oscillospiraceae bacterium]MDY4104123.1 hypothetical protein [Oscillospiraceae bacterium]